jgi:hypothetical protein
VNPELQSTEVGLQITDEKKWIVRRGYENRVFHVLRYLDVAGGVGMSFTYRLKRTGDTSPPWATPARMTELVYVADRKDVWNVRQSKYDDTVFTI